MKGTLLSVIPIMTIGLRRRYVFLFFLFRFFTGLVVPVLEVDNLRLFERLATAAVEEEAWPL